VGAEAGQEEAEVGGQGSVESGFIESGVTEEAAEALVRGPMSAGRTGQSASEATEGQGTTGEEGGAEAAQVLLLVAVEGEGQAVDKDAKCGIMSMEHGLLLSITRVHDAPKEKPFLHAVSALKHGRVLLPSHLLGARSFRVRRRR
jgi:hypothetical protein